MPELPEVESVRRLCDRLLVGHRLTDVEAVEDTIVYETPASVVTQSLKDATVTSTGRKGKVFWWGLDSGTTFFGHLGMSGWVREVGKGEKRLISHGTAPLDDETGRPKFLKLLVETDQGKRIAFTDGRRLGRIWLGGDPADDKRVKALGPDAWTDDLDLESLKKSKAAVKTLLLNQTKFAGIGNWVADEVLLQARISPHRTGESLSVADCQALVKAIKHVLDVAVEADADPNKYPPDWLFHVRWGGGRGPTMLEGREVRRDTIGARTAAWLPELQR